MKTEQMVSCRAKMWDREPKTRSVGSNFPQNMSRWRHLHRLASPHNEMGSNIFWVSASANLASGALTLQASGTTTVTCPSYKERESGTLPQDISTTDNPDKQRTDPDVTSVIADDIGNAVLKDINDHARAGKSAVAKLVRNTHRQST